MTALEQYLQHLNTIHRSGAAVAETSYYPALEALLNDVGKTLKPTVHCVIHIQSKGAGIPDGGLFTANQLQKSGAPLAGARPERGALEVKSLAESLDKTIQGSQVAKYLTNYGQVLVT